MVRMANHELGGMRNTILSDLYAHHEKRFSERKSEIAKENYDLSLLPHQHLIDQLPQALVAHSKEYKVRVKYTPTGAINSLIDQTWTYYSEIEMPTWVDVYAPGYNRGAPEAQELDKRLYAKTAKLCDEMLVIRAEKQELTHFLETTTQMYSGTLQLRKVLPESLHKYLPAEPPKKDKVPRAAKPKADAAPDALVPAAMSSRMVTNLLEST